MRWRPTRLRLIVCTWLLFAGAAQASIDIGVLPREYVGRAAEEIRSGALDDRFVPLPRGHYIPSSDEPLIWLRIVLREAPPAAGWVLTVARHPVESLRLYPAGDPAAGPVWEDGFYRASRNAFRSTAFEWAIPRDARAGQQFYLRVDDPDPSQVRVAMRAADEFERADLRFTVLLVAVLAVLATMAATNAVFFVALRDSTYLHYVAYMLALIGFIALSQGLPYQFDALQWTAGWNSPLNTMFAAITGFFAATFFRRFIDRRRIPRWMDVVLLAFLVAFGLIVAISLVIPAQRVTPLRQWSNSLLLALSGVQLVIAVYAAWRGSREARFFLVAWLAPIVATVLRALGANGVLPTTPWIVNAYLLGQAAQALILSIGLADRSLQLRRQRDRAQDLHERAESRLREERDRRSEAERRASTDALTGVHNRGSIEQVLGEAFDAARDRGTPLCALFIDLDRFKPINDNHGHGAGDLCLALVARRITQELGAQDACGRFGGDEFLVVLPQRDPAQAREVAERILNRIAGEPVPAAGGDIRIAVSIGGAAWQATDATPAILLSRADQAVYRAKHAGRGRVAWAD